MAKLTRRCFIKAAVGAAPFVDHASRAAVAQVLPTRSAGEIAEIWVTNRDAQAPARNAVVELGLPLAPGLARRDGAGFAVFDGTTELASQTDNHSTDLAGNLRWCMLTAMVPGRPENLSRKSRGIGRHFRSGGALARVGTKGSQ